MSLQGHKSDRAQTATPAAGGLRLANPRIQKLIESGPNPATILLIVLGMIIGMVTAYVIIPTEFSGASPRHMSQPAIRQWVRMVAVGHSQDIHYDDNNALLFLQQIPNPQNVVEGLAANVNVPVAERSALEALTEIDGYANLVGTLAPQDPGLVLSTLQVILALAAVAIAVPLLTIAGRTVSPNRNSASKPIEEHAAAYSPANPQVTPSAATTPKQLQSFSEARPSPPWVEDETEKSGTLHPQYGAPVLRTISTYVKGQNFDDSFAIELGPEDGNQFLGECGISVATRVGNELQSVEFWGFDMASQETMTKVFAAPAALSDPALISTVANRVQDPTTDIIAAQPGARLIVDSSAIQIQAEVKSVVCNYGGGTPNSGIETLQIELLAWRKRSQGASLPADSYPTPAQSPFNEYADLQITPPARAASPSPPPPAGSAGSPPAKRPEDDEEDPFGGTGNFMPYS